MDERWSEGGEMMLFLPGTRGGGTEGGVEGGVTFDRETPRVYCCFYLWEVVRVVRVDLLNGCKTHRNGSTTLRVRTKR